VPKRMVTGIVCAKSVARRSPGHLQRGKTITEFAAATAILSVVFAGVRSGRPEGRISILRGVCLACRCPAPAIDSAKP